MHFYTLPNMAKEATLRICKAEVELLTENLNLIEPAVRGGGVTSVYKERQFVANNCYLDNYGASKESVFGFCEYEFVWTNYQLQITF